MKFFKVKCDQCEALVINGCACHEQGCPNMKFPWVRNGNYIMPDKTPIERCEEVDFELEEIG
jgi:hypothetical protein